MYTTHRGNTAIMDDLRVAAFECLLLNPGCDFDEWATLLIEQYPSEVVDAFGTNTDFIRAKLANLWVSPYHDIATDIELTFEQWVMAFANGYAIRLYYQLVDVLKKPPENLQITYKVATTH